MNLSILLILAVLIVVVLAAVAGYYLYQLHLLNEKRQADAEAYQQHIDEQAERNRKSIKIIAQGLIDDQLSLTEGAIRIRVLMDNLPIEQAIKTEFSSFYLLADATAHIPILEAWKKLNTKQKLEFDRERQKIESDHKEFVIDAAKRIINHSLI